HVDIPLVLLQPTAARFGAFDHEIILRRPETPRSTDSFSSPPLRLLPYAAASMNLTERQKKYLRGLAHGRDPIVLIGQAGASPAVANELDSALAAHELVKVKARVGDRELRDELLEQLAVQTNSSLVQRIGNVGVFYRPKKDKARIILPD